MVVTAFQWSIKNPMLVQAVLTLSSFFLPTSSPHYAQECTPTVKILATPLMLLCGFFKYADRNNDETAHAVKMCGIRSQH